MEPVPPEGCLGIPIQVEKPLLTVLQPPHKIRNEHIPHLGEIDQCINLLKEREHSYHAQNCVRIHHLLENNLSI
jgi:hypothetical protein